MPAGMCGWPLAVSDWLAAGGAIVALAVGATIALIINRKIQEQHMLPGVD